MKRLRGMIGEHGRRALVKRAKPIGAVRIDGRIGGGAGQVAAHYAEEIVRLRTAMQEALDVLNSEPYHGAWEEARARRILRNALKHESRLGGALDGPSGDAA